MYLRINYTEGSHQVMTDLPLAFFQPVFAKNGKLVDWPEKRALDIMHDFGASSVFLYAGENYKKMFLAGNRHSSIIDPPTENDQKLKKKLIREYKKSSDEEKARNREEILDVIVRSSPRFNINLKV